MEILSVGEKIKRARIYKRLTLKDICDDKISVSKMSCIENDKIVPDEEILKFIAAKLDISIDYLQYDVKHQFLDNFKKIKSIGEAEKEEFLRYNIYYAKQYQYYDMAFEFMHILFNYYLDKNNVGLAREVSSEYYDICRKVVENGKKITYYIDKGRYLYMSGEYFESASYYSSVNKYTNEQSELDYKLLAKACYYEAESYAMVNEYHKAFEIAHRLLDFIPTLDEELYKGKVYNLLTFLSIKTNSEEFYKFESEAKKYSDADSKVKSRYCYNRALKLIGDNNIDEAKEYICKAMEYYPNAKEITYAHIVSEFLETLINSDNVTRYEELCDEILNYAINYNINLIIERAYYLKAKIFKEKGNFISFEMYMSLSVDFLSKLGDNEQLYNRYLEMGIMYSKFQNSKEALKYFNLAIKLEKRI